MKQRRKKRAPRGWWYSRGVQVFLWQIFFIFLGLEIMVQAYQAWLDLQSCQVSVGHTFGE